MSATPSSRSLARLVLGAAFVLLGWFLASSTSAQADDRGLLGSAVQQLDSTIDSTLAPATAASRDAVEDAATTLAGTVDAGTAAVDRAVDAVPMAPAVKASVKNVTQGVRATTRASTTQVVVPAVERVVAAVEVVTVTAGSLSGSAGAPPALHPLVRGIDPGTGGVDPIETVADDSVLERTPVPGTSSALGTAVVATGSWVTPLSGRSTVSGSAAMPVELPSDPAPVVPHLDLGSLAPSAGAGSGSVLLLVALGLAFILRRPEIRGGAPVFAVARPFPGPVPDPGSRPD